MLRPKTAMHLGNSPRYPKVGDYVDFRTHYEKNFRNDLISVGTGGIVEKIIDKDHIRARAECSSAGACSAGDLLTLSWDDYDRCWRSRRGNKVLS